MFERFTEEARQVVVRAQEEARALKHNYIGAEHLLLGLAGGQPDDVAVLALGLSPHRTREAVAAIAPPGDDVTTGQIPFTPRAKAVLENGLREALALGHGHIDPCHLLLGLVREHDGVAKQVLDAEAVTADSIRERVSTELVRRGGWNVRCEQAFTLHGAVFVCQHGAGHVGAHVEHGDGWVMRWDPE